MPEHGTRPGKAVQPTARPQRVELVRDAQGRLYDAESGAFRDEDDVAAALESRTSLHVRDEDGGDVTQEVVEAVRAGRQDTAGQGMPAGVLDVVGGLLGDPQGRSERRRPLRNEDVEAAAEEHLDRGPRLRRARQRGAITVKSGTRDGQPVYKCECLVHSASTLLWEQISDLRTIVETSPGVCNYELTGDPPGSATGEVRFAWGPVERVRPIRYDLTVVTEHKRLEVQVSVGKGDVRLHGVFELERLGRATSNLTYEVAVQVAASSGLAAQLMKRSATDIAEEHAKRVIERVVTFAESAQFAEEVLGGDVRE